MAVMSGRKALGSELLTWLLFFGIFLFYIKSAHGADDEAHKARVALSYIDCDGDFTIRNGRIGLNLGERFVADTILGGHVCGGYLRVGRRGQALQAAV